MNEHQRLCFGRDGAIANYTKSHLPLSSAQLGSSGRVLVSNEDRKGSGGAPAAGSVGFASLLGVSGGVAGRFSGNARCP